LIYVARSEDFVFGDAESVSAVLQVELFGFLALKKHQQLLQLGRQNKQLAASV
jgi:hypothetical protein